MIAPLLSALPPPAKKRHRSKNHYHTHFSHFMSIKRFALPALLLAGISALAPDALAASIGVNFVDSNDPGVQNGATDSLATGEIAGAPGYSQSNWNNYGRWSDTIAPTDSLGLSTTVSVAWDANNTWRNNANPTLTGDEKLMHGYLDSTGGVAEASFTSIFANNVNKPVVYVSGLSSWLSAQEATSFDLVLYFDGDTTGRIAEYWVQSATGGHTSFTIGGDLSPHLFARDFGDFAGYNPVDPSATSLGAAEDGNYLVFSGITATDTILIRAEEQTERSPISGFQIVAVPEPSTIGLLGLSTVGVAMIRRRRRTA